MVYNNHKIYHLVHNSMNSQKDKFKIPDEVSYLNTAYMSPLLKSVEQVGFEAVSKKCLPYEVTGNDFFEPVEKLKTLFAKLIQAPNPESIANGIYYSLNFMT